jgi:hypothetical protein
VTTPQDALNALVPGQPQLPPMPPAAVTQEQYQYGTQGWFDDHFVRRRFPQHVYFVNRVDAALVEVLIRLDDLPACEDKILLMHLTPQEAQDGFK